MNDLTTIPVPTHDRYYVGGGNIAGILGISPLKTPLDEYHVMLGDSPELDADTKAFFKRRKALEPYAAAIMEERGFQIIVQNTRLVDREFPFLRAEIDAITGDTRQQRHAEFKSVHPMAAKEWGRDGDPEGSPVYVTAQGQWGLGFNPDIEYCDALAVVGFDESRRYPLERCNDMIAWMRDRAVKFWENHVLKRVPPAPSTLQDILNWVEPDPTKVIEASDFRDIEPVVGEYLTARDQAKAADANAEALKARIQFAMAEATTMTLRGRVVFTWKRNKPSLVTDYKGCHEYLVRAACDSERLTPDDVDGIVSNYTKEKPGNRVFLVK